MFLCRSHCFCAKYIINIVKTSGKSTMSKVLSKCLWNHYKLHYFATLTYPISLSSFSKSSNSFLIMKNCAIPPSNKRTIVHPHVTRPFFQNHNQFVQLPHTQPTPSQTSQYFNNVKYVFNFNLRAQNTQKLKNKECNIRIFFCMVLPPLHE